MINYQVGRMIAWDSYMAGLVAMSIHPGAGKDKGQGEAHIYSVEECAKIADQMLEERDKRFKGE